MLSTGYAAAAPGHDCPRARSARRRSSEVSRSDRHGPYTGRGYSRCPRPGPPGGPGGARRRAACGRGGPTRRVTVGARPSDSDPARGIRVRARRPCRAAGHASGWQRSIPSPSRACRGPLRPPATATPSQGQRTAAVASAAAQRKERTTPGRAPSRPSQSSPAWSAAAAACSGTKGRAAAAHGVSIVSARWVSRSVAAGARLLEGLFPADGGLAKRTTTGVSNVHQGVDAPSVRSTAVQSRSAAAAPPTAAAPTEDVASLQVAEHRVGTAANLSAPIRFGAADSAENNRSKSGISSLDPPLRTSAGAAPAMATAPASPKASQSRPPTVETPAQEGIMVVALDPAQWRRGWRTSSRAQYAPIMICWWCYAIPRAATHSVPPVSRDG